MGRDFDALVAALRDVQGLVHSTAPPAEVVDDVARRLSDVAEVLRGHVVDDEHHVAGTNFDIPGRSQALIPVMHFDEVSPQGRSGRVTFGRFWYGNRSAVHAGSISLLFGELLGWLSVDATGGGPTRTAYLNVDYTALTPLDEELAVKAWVERHEGRKWVLQGTLSRGDVVCARGEALYLTPKDA